MEIKTFTLHKETSQHDHTHYQTVRGVPQHDTGAHFYRGGGNPARTVATLTTKCGKKFTFPVTEVMGDFPLSIAPGETDDAFKGRIIDKYVGDSFYAAGGRLDALKAEAKLFIDANVHDGEDRSGADGDSAGFTPDELQELINELIDHLCRGPHG